MTKETMTDMSGKFGPKPEGHPSIGKPCPVCEIPFAAGDYTTLVNLGPRNDENEEVPIIMCTWKRIERLPITLDCLKNQTYKNFEFYVWNNNSNIVDAVETLLDTAYPDLKVHVYHSDKNVGGFGRFMFAKRLIGKYKYVIFIDDDLELEDNVIECFMKERKLKTIVAEWSWNFIPNSNYWNRRPTNPGEQAHYCGTGGMILDISIFNDPLLFNCPNKFWMMVEDLWLSWLASKRGWNLRKSQLVSKDINLREIDDGKNSYKSIIRKKSEFLQYLRQDRNWEV